MSVLKEVIENHESVPYSPFGESWQNDMMQWQKEDLIRILRYLLLKEAATMNESVIDMIFNSHQKDGLKKEIKRNGIKNVSW